MSKYTLVDTFVDEASNSQFVIMDGRAYPFPLRGGCPLTELAQSVVEDPDTWVWQDTIPPSAQFAGIYRVSDTLYVTKLEGVL